MAANLINHWRTLYLALLRDSKRELAKAPFNNGSVPQRIRSLVRRCKYLTEQNQALRTKPKPIAPNKHEWHNPHGLTPAQVGEGFRLLLKEEIIPTWRIRQNIHCWDALTKNWDAVSDWLGSDEDKTYRVPLASWAHDPRTADPRWKLRMTEQEAMELGERVRQARGNN